MPDGGARVAGILRCVDPARRSLGRFLLVVVPMFAVAIGLVVAYLVLRPTIRRNAAILVTAKLEVVLGVVDEVRRSGGGLAAATAERLDELAPEDLGFQGPDQASQEPLVVSVLATERTWTGAARADSGACYFVRVLAGGAVERGTVPGGDCTARAASGAPALGWPEL